MEQIVACGLYGKSPWHDFLTKECYDQRILLHIMAFKFDENYMYVLDTRPDAGKYGYTNNKVTEMIRNLPKVARIPHIRRIP